MRSFAEVRLGFFFLSCWLGTMWGHVVGIEFWSLLAGALLCLSLRRRLGWKRMCLVLLALVSAGSADIRQTAQNQVFDTFSRGDLHGKVTRVRCRDGRGSSLYLSDVTFQGEPVDEKVTLFVADGCFGNVGQWLEARVRFESDDRWKNPSSIHPALRGKRFWRAFAEDVPTFRGEERYDRASHKTALAGQGEAFLNAIVWGERSDLSQTTRDAFVDTGLAHVLAISGLHMGIVSWTFYRFMLLILCAFPRMRNIGYPARWAAISTLGMVWVFVGEIVTTPATLRAAVVITFFLTGTVLGRRSDPFRTLAWAATVLLLIEPDVVFSASFQLSFAAALGIILAHRLLARVIQQHEERTHRTLGRFRRGVLSLMSLNTAAWCVTTPLCLATFGQVSVAGLIVNLGLLPIASMVVIPSAFIFVAIDQISPQAASTLVDVMDFIVGGFLELVDGWAQLLPSSQTAAIGHGTGLLVTLLVLLNLVRPSRGPLVLLALFVSFLTFETDITRDAMRVSMLDVGHGDAALVQMPDGGTLLIDSGGSGRHKDRNMGLANRALIPALSRLGVSSLDVAVITHVHADHMGALERLADRIPIRELWVGPCGTDHPILRRVASRIAAGGGSIKIITRGLEAEWSGVQVQALWPPQNSRRPNGTCRFSFNDASVVLRIDYNDRRLLFVGDLERAGEEALMKLEDDLEASVLKIGHHGSRTSTSSRFLNAVRPSVGLMSGQIRPGRMPPHAEVIQRLHRSGVSTWITGLDGAVTLDMTPDGLIVPRRYSSGRTLRIGSRWPSEGRWIRSGYR